MLNDMSKYVFLPLCIALVTLLVFSPLVLEALQAFIDANPPA